MRAELCLLTMVGVGCAQAGKGWAAAAMAALVTAGGGRVGWEKVGVAGWGKVGVAGWEMAAEVG